MALRCSGRLTVRYATPCSTANRMCVSVIDDDLPGRCDAPRADQNRGWSVQTATRTRDIPVGRVRRARLLGWSTVLPGRPVRRRRRGGGHDLAEQLTGDIADGHPSFVALAVDILLHPCALALPRKPTHAENQPPLLGTYLYHLRIDGLTDFENVRELLHTLL